MNTIPLQSKDRLLMKYLRNVAPSLTCGQLENVSALCLGLLAPIPHKSISAISQALLTPKDQSNLNRTLTTSNWGCEMLSIELNEIRFFQKYKQTRFKSGGFIILDDSLLKKSGSCMDLVGKHFDHCSFTLENGLSLVSVHYTDDVRAYHLLKDIYLRKCYLEEKGQIDQFKTKVELAEDLINTLLNHFPAIHEKWLTFLFDSWFLAKSIVALLQQHDLKYVSRAKSNRKILELDMSLKEYSEQVLKASDFRKITFKRQEKLETAFAYTTILPISKLGDVKVCFIKNDLGGKVNAFLVSNNLRLSEEEIIKHYKERWAIETAYKDTKQYLGLDDFHVRKKKGILRHLTLSYLTSSYLEYLKLLGIFNHALGSEYELSTKGKQVRAYQHILFERFLTWIDRQYENGKNLDALLTYFRRDECSHRKEHMHFIQHNAGLSPIKATMIT